MKGDNEMSLTVSAKTSGGMEPIPGGTYLAVCNTLIDLGDQYNEQYGKTQRKVLIGWELPDETYEKDGETRCRQISSRYTASLDNRGKLKPDLESWRGRVFTQEELAGFDLKKHCRRKLHVEHYQRRIQRENLFKGQGNHPTSEGDAEGHAVRTGDRDRSGHSKP